MDRLTSPSAEPAMTRQILAGHLVTPDLDLPTAAVVVDGGTITWVGKSRDLPRRFRHVTRTDLPPGTIMIPGLIDLHCHGGLGVNFGSSAALDQRAATLHHEHGTTTLVASLVAAPIPVMTEQIATCQPLVDRGLLAGLHLEGPYLSPARRGAQAASALRDADPASLDALLDAASEGLIIHMTYAPEHTVGFRLERDLTTAGVVPAIGHTDADYAATTAAIDRTRDASDARPALVTHVFNGMAPFHHRNPGAAGAALSAAARGDAVLEVIADGTHLGPGTVAVLFDTLGPSQLALVSDSTAATGMPPGRYRLGDHQVLLDEGAPRLADAPEVIAGSASTLLDVLRWTVTVAGIPLRQALTAATQTPATILGRGDRIGDLGPNRQADILVVTSRLELVAVMRNGSWLNEPFRTEVRRD